MTEQLTITPPPELVQQWTSLSNEMEGSEVWMQMAIFAAQWGADQELEACIRHLDSKGHHPTTLDCLRAARRPKPPTLKKRALNDLSRLMSKQVGMFDGRPFDTIRRALEALPDD
jgi:hypothetical protein